MAQTTTRASKKRRIDWTVRYDAATNEYHYSDISMILLQEIRDLLIESLEEQKRLNALLHCPNFTGIPATLKSIRRAMPKPRAKRKGSPQ